MTFAVCKKKYAVDLGFKDRIKPDQIDDLPEHQRRIARENILLKVAKNRMSEPGGQLLFHFDGAASTFTPVDSIHNTGLPSWVAEIEDLSDDEIESL